MTPVSTPCVKLCIMDAPSGLCQGCGRRVEEIASWASMSEPERIAVMAELPRRLAASRASRMAAAGRAPRRGGRGRTPVEDTCE